MINQIIGNCIDAARSQQLRGLSLKFWQLQDRNFGRIVHLSGLYRIAVYLPGRAGRGLTAAQDLSLNSSEKRKS
jgi:hypothetical protein